ncbi:MAG: hypothetical protein KAR06_12425, partial [Deltaproteobacteria bacterium]|nr:hypothetical protein [Deltaproteobacteria bacterium]
TALDSGYTPATIVIDSPLVYENVTKKEVELLGEDALGEGKGLSAEMEEQQKAEEEVTWLWKPRNYEDKFYGPTTIRTALTKSRNVVTVKVLQDVGVTRAINYARKLGIESPLAKDLSLSLGSSGITLLELTTAYATFENLGKRPEPIFITRITDRDGELLEGNQQRSEQVITPQIAYLMTSLLEGVVQHGTAWRVRVNLTGRPAAGKTGTTNNLNDAWFMGYTPELVVGTWIGYDSEKPLGKNETGSKAASPIWIKFMKKVLENTPPKKFPMPEGLEFARIDPETGLLANATTPDPVFEVFVEGTAPIEISKRRAQHPDTEFFKLDIGDERVDEEPREFRDTSEEEAIDLNEPL